METKIKKYFPEIDNRQIDKLFELQNLICDWNTKINVISRKDTENIFTHHILHSLAIAKVKTFLPKECVVDVGTGGGFPGIPLAILFPNTKFDLIDSIEKKICVVNDIAKKLHLENVNAFKCRAETLPPKYDCIISRAVTAFPEFVIMTKKILKPKSAEKSIIYLKGGDFENEMADFKNYTIYNISDIFEDDFFETKKIIYLHL